MTCVLNRIMIIKLTIRNQGVLLELETLKAMEIKEKVHGIKMNLGEFLNSVMEKGFFSYSGSLTTPGLPISSDFVQFNCFYVTQAKR